MMSFPRELAHEPTEEDILHIDPVAEYDRRRIWRDWAQELLDHFGDGAEELIARGRPTGP